MNKITRDLVCLQTIVRRECVRMIRIAGQVFLPPVITMTLYFIIFGKLIGERIGDIHHVPYGLYIAPGLIMMSVIMNAYSNVSSSFYSSRFQHNVEELLVSPTPNSFILLGYVMGGMIRAFVIAILVTLITLFFIPMEITHPYVTFLFILLSATLFGELGFLNAMFARSFEDIMIIPTFFLTPLTYLGGVFYSIDMLPAFWRLVSKINPILYIVNGFRYGLIGLSDVNVFKSMTFLLLMVFLITFLNLRLLHRGVGLKT